MITLILFLLQQNPTYAVGTWTKYGATLENTHLQAMKGTMWTEPIVKWSYILGGFANSYGAAVANIDNDDTMEVVIGSHDNKLYCFNGITGSVKWSYYAGNFVQSCPAIADVDKNGSMEVIFGCGNKKVYCLNGISGTVKWSYIARGPIESSPAVVDINKDDTLEVLFGSGDSTVYSLNGITGTVKWSYNTGGIVSGSSPAIADIDKNDTMEVVFGSWDKKVYSLNGVTGSVKWSYATRDFVHSSSPAIADINKDDTMEVVIGSWDSTVYCFNGITGNVKWSYLTRGSVESSPAIADIDKDDTMEVVIGSWDNKVYSLNGITGTVKWSYDFIERPSAGIIRGISIADVDGDGNFEVLVPRTLTDSLYCLNGENGTILWRKRLSLDITDITIADIDNDGCVELVVGTYGNTDGRKVWVLDDSSNSTNCGCMGVKESNLDFRSGIGDFVDFKIVKGRISLSIPNSIKADIKLYNLCGRMKEVVYSGTLSKGTYTFVPHIKTNGIYFVKFITHNFEETKKLILLK
ncbi:MAG: PQQ-binding-like beta-propeller repeat protein [bacterium]|nr:PQQ-binding-like beta-propeller repeat protein [bacterium]